MTTSRLKYLKWALIAVFLLGMASIGYNVYNNYAVSAHYYTPKPMAITSQEPRGGGAPLTEVEKKTVTPPSTKIKVAGIIDLEFNEASTWATVLKILALILGSAIGIKIINTTFKRFE